MVRDSKQFSKSNYSEWKYLQNRLFPKTVPSHTEWRDIDSIIKILNDIGSMPGLNHMFCQREEDRILKRQNVQTKKDVSVW